MAAFSSGRGSVVGEARGRGRSCRNRKPTRAQRRTVTLTRRFLLRVEGWWWCVVYVRRLNVQPSVGACLMMMMSDDGHGGTKQASNARPSARSANREA